MEAQSEGLRGVKQLLGHRHWLAHGRYFVERGGVPDDPGFAIERTRSLFADLKRIDPNFPWNTP